MYDKALRGKYSDQMGQKLCEFW
ncbi:hypothetical protein [Anaerocolumna sp. AGMB13025]